MQLPSRDELFNYYQAASSKVKQYVRNITPLEQKVMEATSNEKWGPHGTAMAEITQHLYNPEDFKQVMSVLAKRMRDEGEDWRHVYKSLLLMEYMCKHGPQRIVDELNGNLYVIERLQRFDYKDKNGKDWGLNVRQRAKELYNLVTDSDRLRQERQKAKQNESKYTGVGADEVRLGKDFGSSWADRSGSKGHSSGSIASQGFGSSSLGVQGRVDDDDSDAGHHSLRYDDSDQEQDTREATKKRIAALKVDAVSPASKSSPLKGSRQQVADSESRAPKRLSQVQVDPSIAATFGKPKAIGADVATMPPARQPQANAEPPLLFDDHHALPLQSQPLAAPTPLDDGWDAFVDPRPISNDTHALAGFDDLLGGPSQHHSIGSVQSSSTVIDPFVKPSAKDELQAPSVAPADPFSSFGRGSSPRAIGALPLAPQKKEESDPFASISGANFSSKSQALNQLRRVQQTHTSAAPSASSPVPTSYTGLAEDLFYKPSAAQSSPPHSNTRATSGPVGSVRHSEAWSSSPMAKSEATEDLFGEMRFPSQQSSLEDISSSHKQALGGGTKMAPNLPQPNLPPPVTKKDPFAGLAGF